MAREKYRLEVCLPLYHNPQIGRKPTRQDEKLLKKVKNEIRNYFSEIGGTEIRIEVEGTTGWYKEQPEPQEVLRTDVFFSEESMEWLEIRKVEWARMLEQEEIYITYHPITVV